MKPFNYLFKNALKYYQISTMLLVLMLTTMACEDEHLSKSILDDQKLLGREGVTDPTLQYGYLLFQDRTHLQNFYTYLEMVADTATDLDQALQAVAVRLGHNSLIYSDTSAFASAASKSSGTATVYDPLRRVILNSKQEVGVGDSLFVFQNRWEIYSFPLAHAEMRDTLNWTPKGTRVDISKITPETRLVDSDNQAITNRGPICFQFNRIRRANPCTDPFTVFVLAGATLFGFPYGFTMNIDWGDGSTPTVDGANWGSEVFPHTYSTSGTYQIVSTLNTTCAGPITFITEADVEVGGECDGTRLDTARWMDDDDIGMSMEAWSHQDIFGSHVGAKTTCYEFINGKWRQRRGEIDVHIEATFRDVECNDQEFDEKDDDCGNCQSQRASVTSSVLNKFHIEGDATSTHVVDRNNVELSGSIILDYKCD